MGERMDLPTFGINAMLLLTIAMVFMVQQASTSCTYNDYYSYCEDLTSLNDIPFHNFPTLKEHDLHVAKSDLSLSGAISFNGSRVKSLQISSSNITTIQTQFLEKLDRMINLQLRDNHIGMIEMFPDLKVLHSLYLEHNTIGHLPSTLFHQLQSGPTFLIISSNIIRKTEDDHTLKIETLPSELFKNNSLEYLLFTDSGIANLQADTLKGLQKLKVLRLSQNSIAALPNMAFEDLSVFTELHLDFNSIQKLNSFTFKGLSTLQNLVLSHNKLEIIESAWFDGVPALTTLDLGFNKIRSFTLRLSKLEVLILSHNEISSVPDDLFEALPSLILLDLSHNHIKDVSPNAFMGLRNLNSLNLEFNHISVLTAGVFKPFMHLGELSLGGNNIKNLGEIEFHNLDSLKHLNISNNGIGKLPIAAFEKLGALVDLDLGRTNLTSINLEVFRGSNELKHISLEGNRISRLEPDGTRNISSVTFLNLESTPIENLEIIGYLPQVKQLRLVGTKFENETSIVVSSLKITKVNSELWEIGRN